MAKNSFELSRRRKSNKLSMILEILGIMEERGISKDFLLQEIKKRRIGGVRPAMTTTEILQHCPLRFIIHLFNLLIGAEPVLPSVLPPTRNFHWFYTDVIASSSPKITTREQVHKIMVLNELILRTESFRQQDRKSIVILPSGDGYAIGFGDTLESPLRLAIELHKLMNEYNKSKVNKDKVYIRSGIESGIVYFMKDLNGNNAVWGPGIIMARRVMDLGEKMHILTSERIAKELGRLSPENKSIMHSIGNYPVKWEGRFDIYNIYEEGKFGNKIPPTRPPDIPSKSFRFERIELILDIKNPKTMMTHHTQIWNLVNDSNEPKDLIHYNIDGDIPRNFADLHVSVRDSKGKKLKILSLNAKNPLHKEFNVKLNRPIKPDSTKFLKLEWDWEEPNRNYVYKISSECKKFRYILNISNKTELKQRVLKIEPELGSAEYASPTPIVRYHNGKTHISWERNNVRVHDAYRLEW